MLSMRMQSYLVYNSFKFIASVGLFAASFFVRERVNEWFFFIIHVLANAQLLSLRDMSTVKTENRQRFSLTPNIPKTNLFTQKQEIHVAKLIFIYGALVSLAVARAWEPAVARAAPLVVAFTAGWEILEITVFTNK